MVPLWLLIVLASVNSLATCIVGALVGVTDWTKLIGTLKFVIVLTIIANWTGQLGVLLAQKKRSDLEKLLLQNDHEKTLTQSPVSSPSLGNGVAP